MRRLRILAVLAALVLTAAVAAPTQASARHGVLHLRGSDQGTFTTTPLEPPNVLTQDVASGHATHLGRYTLHASEVINLATLAVTDGSYTLTAANGDTIVGTYAGSAAGTSDPAVITYHVEGPVTGGTGRFRHASGWLTFDGVANLATQELSDRVAGWVARR